MVNPEIKFGTAGWRGIISDDFTFDNVRLVSQAIADYLNTQKEGPQVVVGYDTRFLSEEFARASSEVLAANGVKVIYSRADVPTPVISYYIIERSLSGGINITASHNPPQYSGIKFSPDWGGPAMPETTGKIEENCRRLQINPDKIKFIDFDNAVEQGLIEVKDISERYINKIKSMVDVGLIEDKISLAFDPMFGTARQYISRILPNARLKIIHNSRDVLFGGHRPEPNEEYLSELRDVVVKENFDIGLGMDGDADRFGILDSDGTYITPNQVMGLALYHLHRKGYRGAAVRSVMTSSFMDSVARSTGVEVIETPVGFKYIGDIFRKQEMIVGGEESGGLTVGGHLPEKDGILACLLMAELRAVENKPLKDILSMLYNKVGSFVTVRKNYTLSESAMDDVKNRIEKERPQAFNSFRVKEVNTIDGYKFIMDNGNTWLGLRFSGTEPVVRIYVESSTEEKISKLLSSAENYFRL